MSQRIATLYLEISLKATSNYSKVKQKTIISED